MTYEEFYIHWYSRMKNFAREYVISNEDAEDIVQEVLTDLYEKYEILSNYTNLVAYIFTTIRNRCLDHLRHKMVRQKTADSIQKEYYLTLRMKLDTLESMNEDLFNEESPEQVIQKALDVLPDKCRIIFVMHKLEGKKLKEIARILDISPKTAENQITIAYKKLRKELKDYLPFLLLLF